MLNGNGRQIKTLLTKLEQNGKRPKRGIIDKVESHQLNVYAPK
jgi:hypothetical protein